MITSFISLREKMFNLKWIPSVIIISLLFSECGNNYAEGDMIGTWRIIEIKSEENEVSSAFLGAETIVFNGNGAYEFPGLVNERGDWTLLGDKLRLHTDPVKDLKGNVMYEGHDSEWRIELNKKFMMWRGTKRYYNQSLKVLFEKNRL